MGLLLLLFACSLFAVHNLGGSKCAKKPLEMCKKKLGKSLEELEFRYVSSTTIS